MNQLERLAEYRKKTSPIADVFKHIQYVKGDKGEKGDTVIGPKGDKGEKGDTVIGPKGDKGDSIKGGKGDRGPQGESIKGDKGDKGDRGANGVSPAIQDIVEAVKKFPVSYKSLTDAPDLTDLPKLIEFLKRGGFRGGGSSSAGGIGTVTAVSVATANGFGGSVLNSTTTPAISVSTTVTGLLKGNGSAVSAATPNSDYQVPVVFSTTGTSGPATFDGTNLNIPNYSSGSGGITRSINTVSTTTAAGSTASIDYVYLCSGTFTITLPTTVGNTNRYTIKNIGSGVITVATTGGETIDGSTTATIPVQWTSYDFVAASGNWNVI